MNIFKSFTFKWWQGSIFKISVFFWGIACGAFWSQIFYPYIIPLVIIAFISTVYIGYVWWKQVTIK